MAASSSTETGPFMEWRALNFLENPRPDYQGNTTGTEVERSVWSFNLKAVPSSMQEFHAKCPGHEHDATIIHQVEQLIKWHQMPAWDQLEHGGMTLRAWELPSYIAKMPDKQDWSRLKDGTQSWTAELEEDVKLCAVFPFAAHGE
jgi:hypothetical protein